MFVNVRFIAWERVWPPVVKMFSFPSPLSTLFLKLEKDVLCSPVIHVGQPNLMLRAENRAIERFLSTTDTHIRQSILGLIHAAA